MRLRATAPKLISRPASGLVHARSARPARPAKELGSALVGHDAVETLARGTEANGVKRGRAALFSITGKAFIADPTLSHEVFGAASIIVRCADLAEVRQVLEQVVGQLTITLQIDEGDYAAAAAIVPVLERKAGRVGGRLYKAPSFSFFREGGSPVWIPAFAGKQALPNPKRHHPGEGQGPIGKVVVMEGRAPLATSPNWTPAFAGEVREIYPQLPHTRIH